MALPLQIYIQNHNQVNSTPLEQFICSENKQEVKKSHA